MATKTPEEPDLEETSAMVVHLVVVVLDNLLVTQPIKRKLKPCETTVAGAGNFSYDAPGLVNIGRNGE
jgi:hypothetical protein